MSKHRKRPEEKKKRLTKQQLIIAPILVGASVGIALIINIVIAGPPPLEQCIPSEDMPFHQHAYLNVTLNGEPFTVPANIGITSDCVKPLHTHEADGTIHVEFIKPTRFTLGIFVELWGLNLDQYDVKVFVKAADDADFREFTDNIKGLVMSDQMRIKMELTSR
jgi:hypothetical protein